MNKFQKMIRAEHTKFVKTISKQTDDAITAHWDDLLFLLGKTDPGAKVKIKVWPSFYTPPRYQLQMADESYNLTNRILNKEELFDMIKENDWELVE